MKVSHFSPPGKTILISFFSPSMRLLYPIYFGSQSIRNLISVLFPEDYQVTLLFTKSDDLQNHVQIANISYNYTHSNSIVANINNF